MIDLLRKLIPTQAGVFWNTDVMPCRETMKITKPIHDIC